MPPLPFLIASYCIIGVVVGVIYAGLTYSDDDKWVRYGVLWFPYTIKWLLKAVWTFAVEGWR